MITQEEINKIYPELHLISYRELNNDLNHYNNNMLLFHYHFHGKNENRISNIKICFLLKGFNLLNKNTNGMRYTKSDYINNYSFNILNISFDSFYENIYIKLNEIYDTDYYYITYESEISNELKLKFEEKMPKFKLLILKQENCSTAVNTFKIGIEYIKSFNIYYKTIIISRCDLIYKKNITEWLPNLYNQNTFYYLFKEVQFYDYNRISDNIFVVNGDIEILYNCLNECLKYKDEIELVRCLHKAYFIIKKYYSYIIPIIEGYYDTDTGLNGHLSNNPIYKIDGRPYYFD